MKILILLAAVLSLSFTPRYTYKIPVTVDWTICPNAQGMVTFMGVDFANVYLEDGPLQTIYLLPGSDYCITFDVNAPNCTVSTTYSSGAVTHYDPMQCGETLLASYVFVDECE